MRVSALERVFVAERLRHRATVGDFAHAVLHERAVGLDEAPFLVSNKRQSFVQTRRRPDGTIWAGFSEVPIGEEGGLVRELYKTLWKTSMENGWANRCSSLDQAAPLMRSLGSEPHSIVVPIALVNEVCDEELTPLDAEKFMLMRGYVAKAQGLFVLASDLAPNTAILTASPVSVGTYTRTDDSLALMVLRADRALVLMGPDGVA